MAKKDDNLPPLSLRRFVLCVLVATAASNVGGALVMLLTWQPWMWFAEPKGLVVGCVAGPVIWMFSGRRRMLPILAGTFLGCVCAGLYIYHVGDLAPHVLTYMYPNSDPATWTRCLVADYLFVQPLGGVLTCAVMGLCYRSFGGRLRKEALGIGCLVGVVVFIAAKANLHLCYVHLRGEQLGMSSPPPWPNSVMFGLRAWGLGGYAFALAVLAALPVWAERPGSFVDHLADRVFGGRGRRLALLTILILSLIVGGLATYPSVVNHAFIEAAGAGDVARAKRCLALGADPNAKDVMGYSALNYAVSHNRLEMIEFLLAKGLDVNKPGPSPSCSTPLHDAQQRGIRIETVLLLIRKGADVNARAAVDVTPLYVAAALGDGRKVKLLLDNGADVNARAADGTTPLDVAKAAGYPAVMDILRKHGGKTWEELDEEVKGQKPEVKTQDVK